MLERLETGRQVLQLRIVEFGHMVRTEAGTQLVELDGKGMLARILGGAGRSSRATGEVPSEDGGKILGDIALVAADAPVLFGEHQIEPGLHEAADIADRVVVGLQRSAHGAQLGEAECRWVDSWAIHEFSSDRSARHWWQDRHFVTGGNDSIGRCRFSVDPDATAAQHGTKCSTVAILGGGEQLADGLARHVVAASACCLAGRCKQSQNSHASMVAVPLPSPGMSARSAANVSPTRLLVARHGQSEWNVIGRWQGQADPPLSDEGMRQAADAGLSLGMFDAIWASDLQRASLTANIIAEILGVGPVLIDARLRETDVGPWQGLNHAEVEAGWPGFLAERRRPVGFEPYDDAAERMLAVFRDIAAENPGGEVLVVSHGGVIRAVRRLLGAPSGHMPNLGASWFTVRDEHVIAGDIVRLVDTEATGMAL